MQGRLESFVTSFFRGERVDEVVARNSYTDFTGTKDQEGIKADKVAADRVSALMLKLLVILNTRPSLVDFDQAMQRLRTPTIFERARL
jgi:hypothetical protein